jgi:hypothetical protein
MTIHDFTDCVGFVDPASSKSPLKSQRARAAIVIVSQDRFRRVFVRAIWAEATTANALTEKIFELNKLWRPHPFGCEANAMQILFAESVLREARLRDVRLPLVPVYQPPQQKKAYRIRQALQPLVASGRLFLGPEHGELEHELTAFPQHPRVDLVDALASAVTLLPKRALPQQEADDRAGLAGYLRQAGVPEEHIADRVRQMGARGLAPLHARR